MFRRHPNTLRARLWRLRGLIATGAVVLLVIYLGASKARSSLRPLYITNEEGRGGKGGGARGARGGGGTWVAPAGAGKSSSGGGSSSSSSDGGSDSGGSGLEGAKAGAGGGSSSGEGGGVSSGSSGVGGGGRAGAKEGPGGDGGAASTEASTAEAAGSKGGHKDESGEAAPGKRGGTESSSGDSSDQPEGGSGEGSGGKAPAASGSGGGGGEGKEEPSDGGAGGEGSDGGEGEEVHSVVIDAGSTGSRVSAYKFRRRPGGRLELLDAAFAQLKPGLSAYPDDPEAAAKSLEPLIEAALKAVPEARRAKTSLTLKATAGLRLLPGRKAQDILKAVSAYLVKTPFLIKPGAVGIMDGAHEGAYAWLTLNYLLGKLGAGPEATVAAIDLGGGSVQEAFALPEADAARAPEGYVTKLSAGGAAYSVYVHSYLGYGLMAARAKVIESGNKIADPDGEAGSGDERGHPCFAKGTKLKYSYGGKTYAVAEAVARGGAKGGGDGGGSFELCAEAALKALDHDKDCGGPKGSCSFGGVWRGKPASMRRVYYVSSYFWDRAKEAGIIEDEGAIDWRTTPGEFASRGAAVCGKDPSEVAERFALAASQSPYFCLDLAFCHTVLTGGFDLAEDAQLTLVQKVKHNGQLIEASWPLGAAIDELSSPPAKDGGAAEAATEDAAGSTGGGGGEGAQVAGGAAAGAAAD